MGKNSRGDSEKSPQGNISPQEFAYPRGDFDLCHGILPRSLYILSQKAIEFNQYGLCYWK